MNARAHAVTAFLNRNLHVGKQWKEIIENPSHSVIDDCLFFAWAKQSTLKCFFLENLNSPIIVYIFA